MHPANIRTSCDMYNTTSRNASNATILLLLIYWQMCARVFRAGEFAGASSIRVGCACRATYERKTEPRVLNTCQSKRTDYVFIVFLSTIANSVVKTLSLETVFRPVIILLAVRCTRDFLSTMVRTARRLSNGFIAVASPRKPRGFIVCCVCAMLNTRQQSRGIHLFVPLVTRRPRSVALARGDRTWTLKRRGTPHTQCRSRVRQFIMLCATRVRETQSRTRSPCTRAHTHSINWSGNLVVTRWLCVRRFGHNQSTRRA